MGTIQSRLYYIQCYITGDIVMGHIITMPFPSGIVKVTCACASIAARPRPVLFKQRACMGTGLMCNLKVQQQLHILSYLVQERGIIIIMHNITV